MSQLQNSVSTMEMGSKAERYILAKANKASKATRETSTGAVEAPRRDPFSTMRNPNDRTPLAEVKNLLKYVDPTNRECWLTAGMALHAWGNGSEEGYELFDSFSSGEFYGVPCPTYKGSADTRKTWDSYQRSSEGAGKIVTISTLARMAQEGGADLSAIAREHGGATTGGSLAAVAAGLQDAHRVVLGDLWTATPARPNYVIDQLAPEGALTLLAAPGGSGKSALALTIAVLVATGRPFAGLNVQQGPVLVISCEDPEPILRYRLSLILKVYGISETELGDRLVVLDATGVDPVLYRETRAGASLTENYDALRVLCETVNPVLVIIDNASDTYDANENARPQVRAFLRALATLSPGAAVLLLAHVDKATARAGGGPDAYSGSTAWSNSSRSRLFLGKDESGRVVLDHQKSNYGPLAKPIYIEFRDGGVLVPLPPGAADAAERLDMLTVVGLIQAACERGVYISPAPNSPKRAWKVLEGDPAMPKGMTNQRLKRLLARAEREGLLTQGDRRDESNRHTIKCWVVPNPQDDELWS